MNTLFKEYCLRCLFKSFYCIVNSIVSLLCCMDKSYFVVTVAHIRASIRNCYNNVVYLVEKIKGIN